MAKTSNPPNSYWHLGKYMPSGDIETIALKYSYGLTTCSMEFSTIGLCLSLLLNFTNSVQVCTASAEMFLFFFFFPPFFLPCRCTQSNLECFLICILNLSHNTYDLIYLLFMMQKS